ncbi:hypothetical protein LCGC14_1804200 [marine sediment metagenome]|uniref:Uncharacterized protein n=1 Tax=marine sediment metagenome TaxID=412755 RepID=A0A0F9J3G2_9ZZZZ
MKLIVEIDIQDKDVPIWSYSTGIIGYSNRNLKQCKKYLKYFLDQVSGIKIINIKRRK